MHLKNVGARGRSQRIPKRSALMSRGCPAWTETWPRGHWSAVVCDGHPENQRLMKEGSTRGSCRAYLLLQSTNYFGFRTAISKEPVDLHPPVALPYLRRPGVPTTKPMAVKESFGPFLPSFSWSSDSETVLSKSSSILEALNKCLRIYLPVPVHLLHRSI
jgi:hypothetical protein